MVKTAGCGSVMRGFESHYPPQKVMGYRQAVRQRILIPSCAGSNPATLANYRDPERNLRALYFQGKSSNCKGCGVSPQTQTSLKKRRTNPAGWRNIGDFGDFAGDEMCGFRLSSYCSYILLNERRKEVCARLMNSTQAERLPEERSRLPGYPQRRINESAFIQWLQSGDLEIPGGIRILSTDCNCQEVKFQFFEMNDRT